MEDNRAKINKIYRTYKRCSVNLSTDIKYFQNFVDGLKNNIRPINFACSIKGNRFTGSQSWIYFHKQDSDKIMKRLKKIILEENIQVLCNL